MTEITSETAKKDDLTRVIVLVYGTLHSSSPFWCFVAIKPSKYQPFMLAQKEGKVDLYDFKEWGEIIVSGEGRTPPDEITLKVAEMYQTDPSKLFEIANEPQQQVDGAKPKKESK